MTRSDLLKQGYTVEQITVYPMVPKPQAPIMRQVTRHDLVESLKTAALHRENAHAATPSAYSDCQLAAARAELRFAHSCVIFLRYNSIRLLRDEASEAQAVGREELDDDLRAEDEAVWQKSKAISCGRCRKLGTCRSSEAFKQDCVEGNVVLECRLCEPNMA